MMSHMALRIQMMLHMALRIQMSPVRDRARSIPLTIA
jgi:hypothetical protein